MSWFVLANLGWFFLFGSMAPCGPVAYDRQCTGLSFFGLLFASMRRLMLRVLLTFIIYF